MQEKVHKERILECSQNDIEHATNKRRMVFTLSSKMIESFISVHNSFQMNYKQMNYNITKQAFPCMTKR